MKVPNARRLSSGNWFIQLRLGGESVPITAATEKECRHQAELAKAQYLNDSRVSRLKGGNTTLRSALNSYIDSRSKQLSPSTVKGYHEIRDERFQTAIDRPLKSVNWQEVLNKEACSPKTLKNAWRLVASAMRYVDFPVPVVTLAQVPRVERAYLDPDQIPSFIGAVSGTDCEIPALLALSSLRRSEILALTWADVDFKKKRIHVSGARVYGEDGTLVDKPQNKNSTSNRYVPLMIPQLEDALKTAWKDSADLTEKVVTVYPSTLSRRINRVCAANGFPQVGVHGLRHSFASLAYHLHIPEKIAMQIGGWASLETMTKIYTHLSAKDIGLCENELTNFFKNANENANGTTSH